MMLNNRKSSLKRVNSYKGYNMAITCLTFEPGILSNEYSFSSRYVVQCTVSAINDMIVSYG